MAGIADQSLFNLCAARSEAELRRFGRRASCKPVHVCQMVERLAVAGVRNHPVYPLARQLLEEKAKSRARAREMEMGLIKPIGHESRQQRKDLSTEGSTGVSPSYDLATENADEFSLFSDRPLIWLYRHAARQRKSGLQSERDEEEVEEKEGNEEEAKEEDKDNERLEKAATERAATSAETATIQDKAAAERAARVAEIVAIQDKVATERAATTGSTKKQQQEQQQEHALLPLPPMSQLFSDVSLPLVVDLGCGYGVLLLNLACANAAAVDASAGFIATPATPAASVTSDVYANANTNANANVTAYATATATATAAARYGGLNFLGVDMSERACAYGR
jgi:2-polyprenyl-3-methyl-5-hydroxy-6-metoxy-1,4-benzoquinol methylase